MEEEVYKKIVEKKDFADLPRTDVEKIYSLFAKRETSELEKIKLTRDLLRKVYSVISSKKVLNPNLVLKKTGDEILKKHISTRERFDVYPELYSKLIKEDCVVFDLGAGINGLSYNYFNKKLKVKYIAVEAVGQMVDLMNTYFEKNKMKNVFAFKESLFNLDFISSLIKKEKGRKVVFLFKALDSLEMVERNYSKKILEEIVPLVDEVVVSFATRSLVSQKPFRVKRFWFENFLKEKNWKIKEDFEMGNERYIVFSK